MDKKILQDKELNVVTGGATNIKNTGGDNSKSVIVGRDVNGDVIDNSVHAENVSGASTVKGGVSIKVEAGSTNTFNF